MPSSIVLEALWSCDVFVCSLSPETPLILRLFCWEWSGMRGLIGVVSYCLTNGDGVTVFSSIGCKSTIAAGSLSLAF